MLLTLAAQLARVLESVNSDGFATASSAFSRSEGVLRNVRDAVAYILHVNTISFRGVSPNVSRDESISTRMGTF